MAAIKDKPAPAQDPKTGRFLPGNSGGGRPKGPRNGLAHDFIANLHEDWQKHGPEVIAEVRMTKPVEYLKVVASLVPKDLNVNINPAQELSDDELLERIRSLDSAIRPFLDAEGAGGADGGTAPATAH